MLDIEKRLLTPTDLVDLFPGTTLHSWAQRRSTMDGPDYYKVGNRCFYTAEAVLTWLETKRRVPRANKELFQ